MVDHDCSLSLLGMILTFWRKRQLHLKMEVSDSPFVADPSNSLPEQQAARLPSQIDKS